jgi:serine kinase of HPr protein (carbohydrate metabolism regulator)
MSCTPCCPADPGFPAPRLTPDHEIHATLVSVFRRGLLLTGPSGIGKSHLALQLVRAGHALVVDDSPRIACIQGRLWGFSRPGFEGLIHLPTHGLVNVRDHHPHAFLAQSPIDLMVALQPHEQAQGWSLASIQQHPLPCYRLAVSKVGVEHIESYLFRWQRKNAIFACQQGGE